ncbi:MAG: GntR family transcriptional regulator [Actinomycetia bacterium]|nr:GntR family transcriptional regulator [Actinomycetes bacterium]
MRPTSASSTSSCSPSSSGPANSTGTCAAAAPATGAEETVSATPSPGTYLPHGQLSGIAAGLHAVLQLPRTNVSETQLLTHLAERGVTLTGLSCFYNQPQDSPLGLVIGYATPPEHAYNNALIDALRERLTAR